MCNKIFCRISNLCKDYCGILNEESIKKNFPLVYEVLDEVLVCTIHEFKSFFGSPVISKMLQLGYVS